MPFIEDKKQELCRMSTSDNSLDIVLPNGEIIPGVNEILIKERCDEITVAVVTILIRKPEFK